VTVFRKTQHVVSACLSEFSGGSGPFFIDKDAVFRNSDNVGILVVLPAIDDAHK
jgi:hypothetical protein